MRRIGRETAGAPAQSSMRKKRRRKRLLRSGLLLVAVPAAAAAYWYAAEKFGWNLTAYREQPPQTESAAEASSGAGVGNAEPNKGLYALMYEAAVHVNLNTPLTYDPEILQCETQEQYKAVVKATYNKLRLDHRELFFLCGYTSEIPFSSEGGRCTGEVSFSFRQIPGYTEEQLREMLKELREQAAAVTAQIPENSSDYDKALFVHDYLVEHTSYDLPAQGSDSMHLSHTAYAALVQHKAVCSGYASAFSFLMHELNVPCLYFDGQSRKTAPDGGAAASGSHTWNCVQLDGQYYWVDVTWDDPVTPEGTERGGPVRHEYCFAADEPFLKDHIPGDSNPYDPPACTDGKLNRKLRKADARAGISY